MTSGTISRAGAQGGKPKQNRESRRSYPVEVCPLAGRGHRTFSRLTVTLHPQWLNKCNQYHNPICIQMRHHSSITAVMLCADWSQRISLGFHQDLFVTNVFDMVLCATQLNNTKTARRCLFITQFSNSFRRLSLGSSTGLHCLRLDKPWPLGCIERWTTPDSRTKQLARVVRSTVPAFDTVLIPVLYCVASCKNLISVDSVDGVLFYTWVKRWSSIN